MKSLLRNPTTSLQRASDFSSRKDDLRGLLKDGNEDDGALQRNLRPAEDAVIPERTCIPANASVKAPQPQNIQFVIVEPTYSYDLGNVMGLEIHGECNGGAEGIRCNARGLT